MAPVAWDIRLDGRAWGEESFERWQLVPEKFEMSGGKLFWDDEQRERVLGLLLENLGARRCVRLGNPEVWKQAVAELEE
jgi:hypothetical protein